MGTTPSGIESRAFTHDPELIEWGCGGSDTSSWWREEDRDELSVIFYGAAALLGFGGAGSPRYALDVRFRQPNWTGLGLFFGYQFWTVNKKVTAQFQAILLEQDPVTRDVALSRYLYQKSEIATIRSTVAGPVRLAPRPSLGDQWLVVESNPRGLSIVRWNGVDVADLFSAAANARLVARDYLGRFGLMQFNGAATYHHFYYTL